MTSQITTQLIGDLVKKTRKDMHITQKDLALTSGTGLRFIIELEQGKTHLPVGKSVDGLKYARYHGPANPTVFKQ